MRKLVLPLLAVVLIPLVFVGIALLQGTPIDRGMLSAPPPKEVPRPSAPIVTVPTEPAKPRATEDTPKPKSFVESLSKWRNDFVARYKGTGPAPTTPPAEPDSELPPPPGANICVVRELVIYIDTNWQEVNPELHCRIVGRVLTGNENDVVLGGKGISPFPVHTWSKQNATSICTTKGAARYKYSLCSPDTGSEPLNWDCTPRR